MKDGLDPANWQDTKVKLSGTNLLKKILQAEADISDLEINAMNLRRQYCEEIREFADGEIVDVIVGNLTPVWKAAKVTRAEFRVDPFGVAYSVKLINSQGRIFTRSGANIRKKS